MLALRADRVFDGTALVDNPVVLVDGDRILDVGVSPPEGVEIVALEGATLLPGLVDCHQHLVFNGVGTLEEMVVEATDDELLARARANAVRALRAGITTIRDLGDRGYVTLDLRSDISLPTILPSGPPITRVQGHCWYLGGECADSPALTRAVDERAANGCAVVKVMVSGGALTPTFPMWESQFTVGELRSIVDAAHARGLPVAAHCHASEAIMMAIDVGVDSIEHCTFFTPDGQSTYDERLIDRLADSGIAISITAGRLPGFELRPVLAQNLPTVHRIRKRLHELGAPLVPGTDAGIAEFKPHDVLAYAYDEFIDAGLSGVETLQAMTSLPARVIGVGERKGKLARGYDADLVAVEGDPLRDGAALRSVVGVWRAGQPVTLAP